MDDGLLHGKGSDLTYQQVKKLNLKRVSSRHAKVCEQAGSNETSSKQCGVTEEA